jgi:thiamine-phosphate pyrophosphorylase
MTQNASSSSAWTLYVIVDRAAAGGRDPVTVAEAAVRGGADVLQLRDKHSAPDLILPLARQLRALTLRHRIPLIINDHIAVAAKCGADGVHLGQDDASVAEARRVLAPAQLVGKSTHSLEQALAAEQEGADYVGCGPVFATPTKSDYGSVGLGLVRQVTGRVRIPVVCIGGIDLERVDEVREAGARCVAVVRAVCAAADPEAACRELKRRLGQTPRAGRAV